jgi:hypothetical protein
MASIWTTRTRLLLLIAAAAPAANLGRQLYRWIAFGEERQVLGDLRPALEGSALEVMRTQLLADSLRGAIRELDGELNADRVTLARLERSAQGRGLPPRIYEQYTARLEAYNRKVDLRNGHYDRWRGVVNRNHEAVTRYNLLADSMRAVGRRMGEDYLSIPTPAEVAVRHGLDTLSFLRGSAPSGP